MGSNPGCAKVVGELLHVVAMERDAEGNLSKDADGKIIEQKLAGCSSSGPTAPLIPSALQHAVLKSSSSALDM